MSGNQVSRQSPFAPWQTVAKKLTNACSLAYAEMYMSIAAMTLRLGDRLKLYNTTLDDVEIHHDSIVPAPKMGSRGVRVIIDKAKKKP